MKFHYMIINLDFNTIIKRFEDFKSAKYYYDDLNDNRYINIRLIKYEVIV